MSLLHGEAIVKGVVYEGPDNPNGAAVIHVVVDDKIVWHRYTSVVIPPSCTERGYDLHTCTCGDSYKDNYTNAIGHAYESVLQAPTCTEDGYTTHTCAYCGDSYKVTTENALGHDYGDWTITSEPTCVVEGSKRRDCRRVMCDAYETATIPAPGHTSSDWIIDIEPTTVSEGSKHKECTVCGKVLETETIHQLAPLTFTYIDGSVKDGYSVSATDTSVSGDITIPSEEDYVEVISIGDYAFRNCANLTSVVIPNSVTSIGKDAFYNCDKLTHIYYCGTEAEWDSVTIGYNDEYSRLALSGKLYFLCDEHPIYAPSSDDDVSTYGFRGYWHYVDGVPTAWCYELAYLEEVAPTCTKTGLTDGYYCTICGTVLVEQEEVAATGHDWEAYVIKPTCTEQGYTLYACKNSILHNYKDNYTDALGHTWADATCDEPRTCSVCGYTEGSATGHSWNAPTYSWNDSYTSCTATRVCSNNSSHTETATATITSEVTTAATCTTEGVRTYTATFSESWAATQTTTTTIDATGHSWSKTTYTWNGTSSCTASRYCLNDSSHTETREGTVGYAVTKAATCTDTGIGTYTARFTASVGGSDWALENQTKTVTIAAKGHTWVDATCTTPKTCSVCGATSGSALGHTSVNYPNVAPTTTSIGYTGGSYCSVCGAVLKARTKILAYPEFTDVILSERGCTIDVWVKNNNSLPVTCYLWLEDDSGTVMTEYEFDMAANTSTYKSLTYTSSASTPLWVYAFFESVDGDNSYTAEQAVS